MLFGLAACRPSPTEAVDYNRKIIEQQNLVTAHIKKIELSLVDLDPIEMDLAYKEAKEQVEKSIKLLKSLEPFDGRNDYRDSALEVFYVYQDVIEKKYKEIITLYKKTDDTYTKQDEERAKVLFRQITQKMDNAFENITAVQTAFAIKYNITLDDGV